MRVTPPRDLHVLTAQVNLTSTNAQLFFGPGSAGSVHSTENQAKCWKTPRAIRVKYLSYTKFADSKDQIVNLFVVYNPSNSANPGTLTQAFILFASGSGGGASSLQEFNVIIPADSYVYFLLNSSTSTTGSMSGLISMQYEYVYEDS